MATNQGGLAPEELPSLSDFATEVGGAWPAGWYRAEIVSGYPTGSGKIMETGDRPSDKGDSRNLRLAMTLTNKAERVDDSGHRAPADATRNLSETINYRVGDLSAEGLARIKQAREHFRGVRGAWSDKDVQRSSLAVGTLGQLEKALGFALPRHPNGSGFLVPKLLGQVIDVRVNINEDGFNDATAFAPAGSRVKSAAKA